MTDIQAYLLEVDNDKQEAKNVAIQSAAKLQSKQLKLIDLITSLEEYINNRDDGGLRAKSMAYLADVLENTPSRVLSGQERRLLCDFILGRIEGDLEGIGSSTRVLIALEDRGKWDTETAQKVARTFLENANPLKQVKLQTDRYVVIQVFDLLVAKYRVPLKLLHEGDKDFMSNFVTFFEGEKDPRNLMMIFSILHVPMTEWDVHAYAQDLFEAVFNYFPVTFKPPPDDPYGITAQDLKDRLRDCIAANSDFAPHAFPQLLNKLDSTSLNTKRDVLQTIQACVVGYGANTINLYSVTLWDELKFEILNMQEEDLAESALKVLALVAAKFAQIEGPLNAYLKPIIKECNSHLEDAPTKQSQATARILHAVSASAQPVADKVSRSVLPVLFNLYNASESIQKRRGLVEVYIQILRAYSELSSLHPDINIDVLQESATQALEAMLRAVQRAPIAEVSFRLTALEGTAMLLGIPNLLSREQAYQAIDVITNIIIHEHIEGHGDIRSDAIRTLGEMTRTSPEAVRERAIPAFMAEIPDVASDSTKVAPILEAFSQLSVGQQVFDTVIRRLKNKFNAARHQNAPQAYQQALLLAMLYAFTHGSPRPGEDGTLRSSYFIEDVEPLLSNLRESNIMEQDTKTLEIVGRLCNIVLRPQSPHFQRSVYNRNAEWMSPGGKNLQGRIQHIAPFSLYYYAALRPEVVETQDIIALLQAQADIALHAPANSSAVALFLQHVALLINKFIDPKEMRNTLESAKIEIRSLLTTETNSRSVGIAFAIVKALIVQGKRLDLTKEHLQALLHLLSSSDKSVARRFVTLVGTDDVLTKENHCTISGLYKQRTFNQTVPAIVEAVRTADSSAKQNYLIALSGILRWLPYSMIEPSLSSLVPPLLQTLDLHEPADQEAKAPALAIFESVLMHDSSIVTEHAASLITRLLNCTTGPANAAKVRAKSLQCLALVPKQLKRETVVPYRRQVVKKLMPCLDDPKRDVRAEAVRCRKAWLGLEDDEEEE